MKKNNKIEKTFGPLSFTGVIVFVCVLTVPLYELKVSGLHLKIDNIKSLAIWVFMFLIGAFIGFTTTCSRIDYAKKRIKLATKLFGIISVGKWTYLTSDMKLGLKASTENWGAYSRTNRSTTFTYQDLKIILYDNEGTEILPVKKIKKPEFAELELEKLSKLLECQTCAKKNVIE